MEHLLWLIGQTPSRFPLAALVDYQDGLADRVLSTTHPTSGDRSSSRVALRSNLCPRAALH